MKEKFVTWKGLAVPLDRSNIDTDLIIPKQFLQKVTRTGFGAHLFHELRFLDPEGKNENPDFILNQPRYRGASILLTKENFGSGSSREHAPWAILEYGFRAIISPSFADIFSSNSKNNGLLLVCLTAEEVETLFEMVSSKEGCEVTVNLDKQLVLCEEREFSFEIDPLTKKNLIEGNDMIDLTLQHLDEIEAYERNLPAWR